MGKMCPCFRASLSKFIYTSRESLLKLDYREMALILKSKSRTRSGKKNHFIKRRSSEQLDRKMNEFVNACAFIIQLCFSLLLLQTSDS